MNVRTKNSTNGTKNMRRRITSAGSIKSSVRSRGARAVLSGTALEIAIVLAIARLCGFGRHDQAVCDWPAYHDRRADGQRCDSGSVLQIDRHRLGALDIDGIAQDVAKE